MSDEDKTISIAKIFALLHKTNKMGQFKIVMVDQKLCLTFFMTLCRQEILALLFCNKKQKICSDAFCWENWVQCTKKNGLKFGFSNLQQYLWMQQKKNWVLWNPMLFFLLLVKGIHVLISQDIYQVHVLFLKTRRMHYKMRSLYGEAKHTNSWHRDKDEEVK